MKKITKLFLMMMAIMVSSSLLFAQMSPEEIKHIQRLEMQKDAASMPAYYAPSDGTRAAGDACTDPLDYGVINSGPMAGETFASGDFNWYEFTGADNMTVTVSLCGSAFDTKLEVWND